MPSYKSIISALDEADNNRQILCFIEAFKKELMLCVCDLCCRQCSSILLGSIEAKEVKYASTIACVMSKPSLR